MRISVNGTLPPGVTSKDIILHIIGVIGTAGGTGSHIEYAGSTISDLSMEARMTICNMSIEAGARGGIIAPDEKTYEYLKGRPLAPVGPMWEDAMEYWRTLKSDAAARYDVEVEIQAEEIEPTVTWGTSPQEVVGITGTVPKLEDVPESGRVDFLKALKYQVLEPGTPMESIKIDKAFIGSCTNARIEDLRAAVDVITTSAARGGPSRVADGVVALVVPGSGLVKRQAEAEGLDVAFKRAGFDWREAGCSMCLGMNPDSLNPGERCASTSNRNFEGRMGAGGMGHLMSPAMVCAAALTGRLTDVRKLLGTAPIQSSGVKITSFLDYLEPFALTDALSPSAPPAEPAAATNPTPKQTSGGRPKFTVVSGFAAPFNDNNIDTDAVIPKQFLRTLTRTGLGKSLFFGQRYDSNGKEVPEFVLNREPYRHAKVLVSKGVNFAIGSAREHAAWSFNDFGIRGFIAPSIGETFTSK